MDIMAKPQRRLSLISPSFKKMEWLDEKLVLKGYIMPVKSFLLIVVFSFSILVFSVLSLVFFGHKQVDSSAATVKEVNALVGRIGHSMDLPVGEQPTLATVTDQTKLGGQDFFARAQNGDKLLVYSAAKKAILYRPSTGKIIDVTNLIAGQTGSAQSSAEPDPSQNKTSTE